MIRAATEYRGSIPPAVFRFKYAGRKSLAQPLGALLHFAWQQEPSLHDIQGIIPVPLYHKNERVRGFNQAELLATQLAKSVNKPMLPLLIRTRKTYTQTELNRTMRQKNVQSAFAFHPFAYQKAILLQKCSFLLIDDVCTTASTLGECARVLYRAGIRTVKALVLARDL